MKKFFITESDRNQIKSLYQTKGLLNEEYGTLNYDGGGKYVGEYIINSEGKGVPEGYGTMTYENNGGVHVGYFKNGEASGYGTYTKSNGYVYEGNWENDYMNGYGTYKSTYGSEHYEGNWKDGKYDGYGTFTWPNGNKYVGDWKNNQRNGYGTTTSATGAKYVGNYKDGYKSGYGTLTYHDGTVEQGNWVDDEFQGGGENSTQNDSTTPPGDASTDQPENCDELMELAKAESVYNVCNLQNGKVVIGLKNQGPLVKYIQCILNQQEDELAELVLDGIFGPKTKEKVEKFQQNNEGLTVDGIVGKKTFEKFNLSPEC
jgi:hypothetical protein